MQWLYRVWRSVWQWLSAAFLLGFFLGLIDNTIHLDALPHRFIDNATAVLYSSVLYGLGFALVGLALAVLCLPFRARSAHPSPSRQPGYLLLLGLLAASFFFIEIGMWYYRDASFKVSLTEYVKVYEALLIGLVSLGGGAAISLCIRWLRPVCKRLTVLMAALVLMVVGVWCVIWIGSISQHSANADVSRPPNVKIALLGIDAASWNFLLPWIEQGKLPQFQRLMAEGSWGVLRSRHPTRSPAIWTSIVTGKKRTKHGIYDFMRQENGQQVPSGSHHRRVEALWNILSEQQRAVWVIDWMASYPPETVHGVMVTNLLENQAVPIYNQPDSVYPLELKAELDHLTAPYRPPSFHYPPGRFTDADYARLEQKYLKELEVVEQVALYGCDQTWDLFALYTHAPDAVLHHFWKFMEPQRFRDPIYDLTPENTLRFGDTALQHFQRIDEMLGRLLACFDHNTIVVLVSDHGQRAQTRKPTQDNDHTSGHHHNDGIVIIAGPGIRRGHLFSQNTVDTPFVEFGKMMNDKILPVDIDGSLRSLQLLDYVDVTDITPTILYLLGLPVANDMDGRVIARAIDVTHLDQHAIRYIPTYEKGSSVDVAPRSAPMSKEMKERLRSLGYIQ